MKRKNVGKRLFVALLVGAMTFSSAKMPVMATEGQQVASEEHVYSAPTDLCWDASRPGCGSYKITDDTRGYVSAALYKDGNRVFGSSGSSSGATTRTVKFYHGIYDSGTYTFQVKMSANNGQGHSDMSFGAVSVMSEPFVYNRPAEVVATPGNLRWSSEEPNVAQWDPVENVSEYLVYLYENDRSLGGYYVKGGSTRIDLSSNMADTEGNSYKFCVRAYSTDITRWANSEKSGFSEIYGATSREQTIQNNIANAANADASTVNEAVSQLKTQNDTNTMCNAIQNSETAQQNLSKLEDTYNQTNGISVTKGSTVDAIPTEGMSVIGAGLNVGAGSTVSLNVSPTPSDPAYDTDVYKNVIAFDMKLTDSNGETRRELTQLEIPAVITLPIPAGMDTAFMYILHFKSDGSVEKITPALIENNTKAKFTITSFSTFAFANENQTDQVKAFVSRMYTEALGRTAEEAGLNDWSNQLKSQTNDGAGLAHGFIESDEFKTRNLSNEDYLTVLYRTFFDRDPDEGGFGSWLAQLNAGTSRHNVLAGFVNSEEFTNLCNRFGISRGTMALDGQSSNNQVRAFVERMYVKALGRQAEAEGVDSWTQRITSGEWQAADVAKAGFFTSQEYIGKNRTNEEFVEDLYQALFDRPSDEAGKADWLNKLANGISREDVMNGFGGSQEFANMLAGFGL